MSVEVSIPDEVLNMDPSEFQEPTEDIETQQQTTQDTANVSKLELNFFPYRKNKYSNLNCDTCKLPHKTQDIFRILRTLNSYFGLSLSCLCHLF